MKKSFWNKTQVEMTLGDSVKWLLVVYAMVIAFSAILSAVMFKIEDILDWVSENKTKIKNKFTHKKWVQTEEEPEEDLEWEP